MIWLEGAIRLLQIVLAKRWQHTRRKPHSLEVHYRTHGSQRATSYVARLFDGRALLLASCT